VPLVGGLTAAGILLSAGLIILLRPWLIRYALARPSSRGLHRVPTPQGGGVAVLASCAAVAVLTAWITGLVPGEIGRLCAVLLAAAGLALLGLIDDIYPLPALPRLALQIVVMIVGVAALPEGSRVLPQLPLLLERSLLVLGGVWLINLTNFMDGMDWITVVDTVPLCLCLVVAWFAGFLPTAVGLLPLGLVAGLGGFAPFNRPVARLFLGDVGSLPIGFLTAYALFSLAGAGHLAAAVILPLYPVADSTVTLAWRLFHRQRVWEPHRNHFYQVAVARGLTVWRVLAYVAATNTILVLIAWSCLNGSSMRQLLGCTAAAIVVVLTLLVLSRGAPSRAPRRA
jgi:UDP-N-acetylmuramyl pentapeptide phosphotransferase/UDP-N-acetylglucosamine-1-phosphate transferase